MQSLAPASPCITTRPGSGLMLGRGIGSPGCFPYLVGRMFLDVARTSWVPGEGGEGCGPGGRGRLGTWDAARVRFLVRDVCGARWFSVRLRTTLAAEGIIGHSSRAPWIVVHVL